MSTAPHFNFGAASVHRLHQLCGLLCALMSISAALPLPDEQLHTWDSLINRSALVATDQDLQLYYNSHSLRVESLEISDDEWRRLMTKQLQRYALLNQVIDAVPPYVINVDYHSKEAHDIYDNDSSSSSRDHNDICPHLGNQLDPVETRNQPVHVSFPSNSSAAVSSPALHTLVAIDPDVPSRQNSRYSEFLHWLVVNIPGDDIQRGNFLADYVGPLPSQGAGPHRFIFLVYRQLDGLIDTSRMPRASRCDWMPRARFSVRKFAQLHGLNQPTAVNFFLTQFDASVPQTISQCLRAKP